MVREKKNLSLGGGIRQKLIFEHNSTPNYLTMTKLQMGQLDMNTKQMISPILEFSILRGDKGDKR